MKPRCKLLKLCLLEFAGQWKMLLIFFLISILILSPLISIVQMAVEIPEKIDTYTYDYAYTWIKIDGMKEEFLEIIEKQYSEELDVYVYDTVYLWGKDDKWNLTNLVSEGDIGDVWRGEYISNREISANTYIDILNQQILQGEKVTDETYGKNYIWIEDDMAEMMSLTSGDIIEIAGDEDSEDTTLYTVKGIYQNGEDEDGFNLLHGYFFVTAYEGADHRSLSCVELYPHTLQCYAEIMKKLQQTGYKDDMDTNVLERMRY